MRRALFACFLLVSACTYDFGSYFATTDGAQATGGHATSSTSAGGASDQSVASSAASTSASISSASTTSSVTSSVTGSGGGGGDGGAPLTYPELVLADMPFSYWRFGELSGSTAEDELKLTACSYQAQVKLGVAGAIVNDANTSIGLVNGQYANCPAGGSYFPGAQFTVEVWVLAGAPPPGAASVGQRIASHRSQSMPLFGWRLMLDPSLNLIYEQWTGGAAAAATVMTPWPNDGKWHHTVVTGDNAMLHLYIDGVELSSDAEAPLGATASTAPLVWGAQADLTAGFFGGDLDEAAIYMVPLSAARVKAHYLKGSTGN